MQINLSGHHINITDGIKTQVNAKLSKIAKRYPSLIATNVILGHEPNKHTVEINTSYEGVAVGISASENNLFAAIASACKKLDAALAHRKGSLQSKQYNKPLFTDQRRTVTQDTEQCQPA